MDGMVQYRNKCEKIKDPSPCPDGMFIKATETGEGECDCKDEHVYWAQTVRDFHNYYVKIHCLFINI